MRFRRAQPRQVPRAQPGFGGSGAGVERAKAVVLEAGSGVPGVSPGRVQGGTLRADSGGHERSVTECSMEHGVFWRPWLCNPHG